MANIHEYPVTMKWQGGRDGSGTSTADRSGVGFPISVPPEFQGPGNGTNPEELLCSAVAACYSMTFGIIAVNRKLPYLNIETKATGEVEQAGMQFTYQKITLNAKIVMDSSCSDADMAAAEDMAHKADLYCIITNALRGKVEIVVQPTVVRG